MRFEQRFLPVVVLALAAALVLTLGLWAMQKSQLTTSAAKTSSATEDEVIHWKLVTTWPANFPGLGTAPVNFAKWVNEASGGRLQIKVYGAGEIVPAFEVFDAVSQGVAEAGHSAAYYWKGKLPGTVFFTAIPFGMTTQETNAWLHYGGGMELWRELYAHAGVVPFAGGSTGVQMMGWFNKPIEKPEDINGLKMRIPGLAGEVFNEAGGTAVRLPGSELYTSLQTGVIDATEWVGPYNDLAFGMHQVAKYYYYPGWHEPGAMLEFIVNEKALKALPEDLQTIVRLAARAVNQDMLDEFTARNNAALRELVNTHGVTLKQMPPAVARRLFEASQTVMDDLVADDPMAAKINSSYQKFLTDVSAYHGLSEQAYINMRSGLLEP
ncbi:MAG: ABC transporter substrate-binding protein [Gammaproteobacteria bacterium]|nr:MAG: ABC transporter substrate-binding protein [Gammaproteobacteria bacterium]